MGYLRRVRTSGEKGASRGRQEKGTIVTAYVLYCFNARGVIAVRYCLKWFVFDRVNAVRTYFARGSGHVTRYGTVYSGLC